LLLQINLDFDGDEDSRVLLLVHDTKPPFLEGKVGSTCLPPWLLAVCLVA